MERFKSVLVEDGEALRTMALYIDLNPVRAGLVKEPADYRWSGYGAAAGGSKAEQAGLCAVAGEEDVGNGAEPGKSTVAGCSPPGWRHAARTGSWRAAG